MENNDFRVEKIWSYKCPSCGIIFDNVKCHCEACGVSFADKNIMVLQSISCSCGGSRAKNGNFPLALFRHKPGCKNKAKIVYK